MRLLFSKLRKNKKNVDFSMEKFPLSITKFIRVTIKIYFVANEIVVFNAIKAFSEKVIFSLRLKF